MGEIYISCDIETDGPIPGPHSMLSFGCAAFTLENGLIDTFNANLETLPGASGHPKTMEWWKSQQEAWNACRKDLQDPADTMQSFIDWVKQLPGKPVFVAYPAGFDFLFMYWYLMKFAGYSPFSFSALDIKSYTMAVIKKPYRDCSKRNMPRHWFPKKRHTHIALDDAIEQGELFMNILKENLSKD